MTVNPGFGGQKMITECLSKVAFLDEYRRNKGYNYFIEVDGGVNLDTASAAFDAGADVLVTGSSFFRSEDPKQYVLDFLSCSGKV